MWGDREENAFQEFKGFLADPKKLSVFNKDLKTVMVLDGSNLFGLGWVLTQLDNREGYEKKRNIISFGSSKLNPTQQKFWSPCEIESLSLLQGVRKNSF